MVRVTLAVVAGPVLQGRVRTGIRHIGPLKRGAYIWERRANLMPKRYSG